MDAQYTLSLAFSALGTCIVAIGWWVGNSLVALNENMQRVLVRLEAHETRLDVLDTQRMP